MKELLTFDSLNTEYGIDCIVSNINRMNITKNLPDLSKAKSLRSWSLYMEMHTDLFDCWKYYYAERLKRNAANRNI